ncbi:hypothetical protein NDU88_010832 [Pleurodeles waltl]|uniref:Uncharacterized protein n=1 Tax=Pleurodeles waltl TaxID=8319 RepID=A0AAV7Q336_PLEWA|nr:hypothetical protein NDU88_010832 [Pleurodeles waltl]
MLLGHLKYLAAPGNHGRNKTRPGRPEGETQLLSKPVIMGRRVSPAAAGSSKAVRFPARLKLRWTGRREVKSEWGPLLRVVARVHCGDMPIRQPRDFKRRLDFSRVQRAPSGGWRGLCRAAAERGDV